MTSAVESKPTTTAEYIQAFLQYSGASKKEIKYTENEYGVIFLHNGNSYQVSKFEDFCKEYKDYFDNNQLDEIYTQTHEGVWQAMLREGYISENELIVSLYHQWTENWYKRRQENDRKLNTDNTALERSWRELQIMFTIISNNINEAIEMANKLDVNIISMIAIAIKNQFEDEGDFYTEAITILLENGESFVTYGDVFELVDLNDSDNIFYIYNPLVEFKDYQVHS